MPTPIETTLSTLLPTVHALPPELVSLSTSLLAQSRAKAAALKPEEEIGRTYACCHIACQRLGHKLALEIAKPAPPVQPRVYNKLHTYFNTVLTTPKTPRKQDKLSDSRGGQVSSARGKNTTTPVKQTTTPTSNGKRKADVLLEDELPEMPKFVGSMIRGLAQNLATIEAAPHVFAGVESAFPAQSADELSSKKRRRTIGRGVGSDLTVESLPAIISIIFPAVTEKMYGPEINNSTLRDDTVWYTHLFLSKNTDKIPFFLPTQDDIQNEVTQLCKTRAAAWLNMEWYQNVPFPDDAPSTVEQASAQQATDQESRVKSKTAKTPLRRQEKHGRRGVDGDEHLGPAGLLPGLGTMFQPSLDHLSHEKRTLFEAWRKGMMFDIKQLEAQKA